MFIMESFAVKFPYGDMKRMSVLPKKESKSDKKGEDEILQPN